MDESAPYPILLIMNVTFLGSGAWATALAYDLSKNHHEILLYGIDPKEVSDIEERHCNSKYFPDVTLPASIHATGDIAIALDHPDVVVLAVPSHAITSLVEPLARHCKGHPYVVNVIKGFDPNTGEGITSMIQKTFAGKFQPKGLVSLVGPSFAYDVIHDDLTAVCAVSQNEDDAKFVQTLFSTSDFRVYVQSDVIGAEIGAGMKNIVAIASGIMEGLGYKDNTRAALITRGLAEITRFGVASGAHPETFLGLTGVGDLCLTASSHRSRNYEFGIAIGERNDAKDALANMTKTVEGVLATKTIHLHAKRLGIRTPIVDAVYAVLYEGAKPSDMARALMERELKSE